MKEFILQYIRSIGVRLVLTAKTFDKTLIYYLFDWIGRDKCYYSLLVICNETQIFTKSITALGCSSDDINPLVSNLRQFDTKHEWNTKKWTIDDIERIDAFVKANKTGIELHGCDTQNYKILSFGAYIRPLLQFVVSYSHGTTVQCMSLIAEKDQVLVCKNPEHKEFLQNILRQLQLEGYYRLEEDYDVRRFS